ncbi:hypothetical protein [Mycobacteroides salmoniphilum]|uniref:hypothetical protein n=1 Tax=Mycobacteroides salmoniphilum TaxID=404941 RepID=UPI0009934B44|nr:hypothetical protein [Mycobacteroides salmoniphilum]
MTVLVEDPIVDAILDRYASTIGDSLTDYRNHLYRGMNYQLRLLGMTTAPPEIALAWATHDIGIWTAGTWDYLDPSVALAEQLAPEFGIDDAGRTTTMVADHHKLRSAEDLWVETFRLGDRIDAFHGLYAWTGLERADVREVVEALPYGGFHGFLVRTAGKWTLKHPLRPMPMLRW